MKRKYLSAVVASVALVALGLTSAVSASADTLKEEPAKTSLVAFLGNPPAAGPVGLGAASDFGIGANILFQAATGVVGTNLSITLGGNTDTCTDSFAGGTLVSNTTGVNNPIGLDVQFADLQKCTVAGAAAPTFTDTKDNVWRARIALGANASIVENLVFDVNGTLVRGDIKGTWINGTATTPSCLELTEVGTLATDPGGVKPGSISGKLCMISANNYGPNDIVITSP